ncbi:MAG TPA: glycosyltransferase family 2 protein [Puia sp.]|nr:glycosyltransferase family 2 protein [Puia sp.]
MVLSVIIVNYRVRYFLELCLHSLQKALRGIESEILVVDNYSADGSLEQLRPLFPGVTFLANDENLGFSKANNQALRIATGNYILFLNPDTVVPEDFAHRCLSFLETTPGIGGLGVRMVDGSGRFLKESRRGVPTPWVAFSRLSGLSALFPKSRRFSSYYLGYLPADKTQPAAVLSGACLWVSRGIVTALGGFDEQFFMYAEDIDLSYRLERAGYRNYYLADTTIVHFKGESTRKDMRYVRHFYKAMSQFRRKHFRKGLPALLSLAAETAIWCRAGIVALIRAVGIGLAGLEGEDPGRRSETIRTCVTGDAAETRLTTGYLKQSGQRVIVSETEEADEIIYCQGAAFSFHQCISRLEADAPYRHGRQVKFHAAGTRSATGSADPNGRGETLVF